MPLPANKSPWPPPDLTPVFDQITTWSAWWTGDADHLAATYGGTADYTRTGFYASEKGGFRTRLRSTLQRWFWGSTTPAHEQRTKLHVPIAGSIAQAGAELLFAEPPKITAKDTGAQDRLDQIVDDGVHATLLEGGEVAGGLGGVYLRVCWDVDVADRPWLDAVHADAAIPEWRQGRLSAVTFWQVIDRDDKGKIVRHLQRYEPGVILHAVYVGTNNNIGVQVPLSVYPQTEGYQPEIRDGIPPGRLLVEYVPNMRPNRLWRDRPVAAPLGRADFAGTEPQMDALDEVWSSWMRDVRLGKARLIVPAVYLQQQGRGQGARFDVDQELYETLNMLPPSDGSQQITEVQFAIRVADHANTAKALLAQILRDSGYSQQTLGETQEGAPAATATEIRARERRSYTTRSRKIVYWRPALSRILETMLMVDALVFKTGVTPEAPDLEFPDSVSEDPGAIATVVQLLHAADAASLQTRIQMVHPDWDDDAVREEIDRIRGEQAVEGQDPQQVLRDLHGATPPGADGQPAAEEEPDGEPAGAGRP